MLFKELSTYWEKIERIASRNEMIIVLAELFKRISFKEIDKVCYLSLGTLRPSYDSLDFNISEKTIAEVISRIVEKDKDEVLELFGKVGDWGDLMESLATNQEGDLSIVEVYDLLIAIAGVEGSGSQEVRINKLIGLLSQLDKLSAKYVLRVILKKLRLGFSNMTILDGLSWMETGTKELREKIETAYNLSADIGRVAVSFKKEGLKGLKTISIVIGVPIVPSAAERLQTPDEIFEKLGVSYVEPKIDGFRIQVHMDKNRQEIVDENSLFEDKKPFIRFYSRNLENMSLMFPELQEAVAQIDCQTLILEGEAVAYDESRDTFYPFQLTMSRKRKHDVKEKAKEVPLTLFVFDLLYLNGESFVDFPFTERRTRLEQLLTKKIRNVRLIKDQQVNSAESIATYFSEKKEAGLEGIMIKMKEAPYKAGARGFHWVKYKRVEGSSVEDSIDVAVLGYYQGKGKRFQFGIGAILVGVYDEAQEKFVTIAKIGTGIKDEEFKQIKIDCDKIKREKVPLNVDVPKDLIPDVWVVPTVVAVVLADEITKSPLHTAGKQEDGVGYALRFPRLIQWDRPDKDAEQVTTVSEVKQLYKNQFNK